MSDTTATLRGKIATAGDLQSVVRTMKALATSSIGQYERSVHALADYYRAVELGLGACFRRDDPATFAEQSNGLRPARALDAVVFGSDQGLVGQFNEVVVDHAMETIGPSTETVRVWAVGERVHARLTDADLRPTGLFAVPTSVEAISPLVAQILVESETAHRPGEIAELHLFYNRSTSKEAYAPVSQRMLPLDQGWGRKLADLPWPREQLPEIMGSDTTTLRALVREYLFISLYRACAASLMSENASRLAAMERADRNIDELLEGLHGTFHRLRQSAIDEELFEVIAGFEAQSAGK